MPIYAYACASCGLQQDVMQKISDVPLTACPECGKATFSKQLTAAGFQLKGSGYYVTDFKDGPKKPDAAKPNAKSEAKPESAPVPASAASTGAISTTAGTV
jgi:putative FmdB family regulatory protein